MFKNLGFRAGINLTRFEWEFRQNSNSPVELAHAKRNVGYNFYITTDLMQKKMWDINSSIGWIQKNGSFYEPEPFDTSVPYKLDYLSLISAIRGKLPVSKSFSVIGQAAPRMEYLLNPSRYLTAFAPNDDHFFYYYQEKDIQRFNVGISTGIGFILNKKKFNIGVEAWRNFNFNPIVSAKGPRADGLGDEGFYLKMRDKTFIINLLFIFHL